MQSRLGSVPEGYSGPLDSAHVPSSDNNPEKFMGNLTAYSAGPAPGVYLGRSNQECHGSEQKPVICEKI